MLRLAQATILILPVAVAYFSLGLAAALGLTALSLIFLWIANASGAWRKPIGPDLVLESILVSHFVEKVRWSLDRLGVPYEEKPNVGVVGAFLLARSVPVLHVRAGLGWSRIANSSDILRYLWGRYRVSMGAGADFLEPTEAALSWEARLDRYGSDLQRWVYSHVLPNRAVTLGLWGVANPHLPLWQRWFARLLYPGLSWFISFTFQISPGTVAKSVNRIEALLSSVEQTLADGRPYLLGKQLSFVDISLAALSSLWVRPTHFAAGEASHEYDVMETPPPAMTQKVEHWRTEFPLAIGLIERLYATERL